MLDSLARQRVRVSQRYERLLARLGSTAADGPRDRGDVPGWVLVTIMTAGLVVALWAIAHDQLSTLFTNALGQVAGGPK
jgi:hypothetical protein